jgi:hypothetical protein
LKSDCEKLKEKKMTAFHRFLPKTMLRRVLLVGGVMAIAEVSHNHSEPC